MSLDPGIGSVPWPGSREDDDAGSACVGDARVVRRNPGRRDLSGDLLRLAERPNGLDLFDSSITSWTVAHRTEGLTTLARSLSTVGSQKILLPIAGVPALLLVGRRQLVPAGLVLAAWRSDPAVQPHQGSRAPAASARRHLVDGSDVHIVPIRACHAVAGDVRRVGVRRSGPVRGSGRSWKGLALVLAAGHRVVPGVSRRSLDDRCHGRVAHRRRVDHDRALGSRVASQIARRRGDQGRVLR